MAALTRWVLAHKRIVAISWLLLTIAGMAAAGPASERLDQEFEVPNKEGFETSETIAALYDGTGGDCAPLVPVVTLPEGKTVSSPGVRDELAEIDSKLEQALPGARIASYASTDERHVRLRRRPHRDGDRLPGPRPRLAVRREPGGREGRARRDRRTRRSPARRSI